MTLKVAFLVASMVAADYWVLLGCSLLAYAGACGLALTLRERSKYIVLFLAGLFVGAVIGAVIGLRINADHSYHDGYVDGVSAVKERT